MSVRDAASRRDSKNNNRGDAAQTTRTTGGGASSGEEIIMSNLINFVKRSRTRKTARTCWSTRCSWPSSRSSPSVRWAWPVVRSARSSPRSGTSSRPRLRSRGIRLARDVCRRRAPPLSFVRRHQSEPGEVVMQSSTVRVVLEKIALRLALRRGPGPAGVRLAGGAHRDLRDRRGRRRWATSSTRFSGRRSPLPAVSSPVAATLVAGVLVATIVDIRTRRIPNLLTATMAVIGLGLAATGVSGLTVWAAACRARRSDSP